MSLEEVEMLKLRRFVEHLSECGIVMTEYDPKNRKFVPVKNMTQVLESFVENEAVYMSPPLPY